MTGVSPQRPLRASVGSRVAAKGPAPADGDSRRVGAMRRAILDHFDAHRRPLPWRTDRSPYRVLVSEFMLQQTRVEAVEDRYRRWIREFPDWGSLARAPRDAVMLAWAGLGYYARAVNLHRTAKRVCEEHGGALPGDPDRLRALPGVGEYTAAAVASIAFGRPVAAVDGNVRRVLSRLWDLADPTPARLRRIATDLLDPARPGDFNEAVMELGATVCRPRAPLCGRCPLRAQCRSRMRGTVAQRPASRSRRRPRPVDFVSLVAVDLDPRGPRTLLVRRPPEGLLAGMWEFPSLEFGSRAEASGEDVAFRRLLAAFDLGDPDRAPLPPVAHAFTHLRATYRPFLVRASDSGSVRGAGRPESGVWVRVDELTERPLSAAQRKIARRLGRWLRSSGYDIGRLLASAS